MDSNSFWFSFEPLFMQWLQSHLGIIGQWTAVFLTYLAEPVSGVAIGCVIYWCFDKEYGKILGENQVSSALFTPLIKNVFLRRRPYFDHPGIKCLKPVESGAPINDIEAQGYSFPSGHSTNASAVTATLATLYKKRIFKVLAVVIPILVALSRVALGVHYPTDVLAGLAVGYLTVFVMAFMRKRLKNRYIMYLIVFAVSATGIFFCKTEDYFTTLGIQGGFFLAMVFEEKFVGFTGTRSPIRCILRTSVGFALYFALNYLLKLPFSSEFLDSGTLSAHLVRSGRYLLTVFLLLGVYPKFFVLGGRFE